MAKKWYPVVDYLECMECGACVDFCPHEVYDKGKTPSPVVINPDACIDHCHGCGNLCPTGSIAYVGEDTGWQPAFGKPGENGRYCDCSCDCNCAAGCEETASKDKTIAVDF